MKYEKSNMIILIIFIFLQLTTQADKIVIENRSISSVKNSNLISDNHLCQNMRGELMIKIKTKVIPVLVRINLNEMAFVFKNSPKKGKFIHLSQIYNMKRTGDNCYTIYLSDLNDSEKSNKIELCSEKNDNIEEWINKIIHMKNCREGNQNNHLQKFQIKNLDKDEKRIINNYKKINSLDNLFSRSSQEKSKNQFSSFITLLNDFHKDKSIFLKRMVNNCLRNDILSLGFKYHSKRLCNQFKLSLRGLKKCTKSTYFCQICCENQEAFFDKQKECITKCEVLLKKRAKIKDDYLIKMSLNDKIELIKKKKIEIRHLFNEITPSKLNQNIIKKKEKELQTLIVKLFRLNKYKALTKEDQQAIFKEISKFDKIKKFILKKLKSNDIFQKLENKISINKQKKIISSDFNLSNQKKFSNKTHIDKTNPSKIKAFYILKGLSENPKLMNLLKNANNGKSNELLSEFYKKLLKIKQINEKNNNIKSKDINFDNNNQINGNENIENLYSNMKINVENYKNENTNKEIQFKIQTSNFNDVKRVNVNKRKLVSKNKLIEKILNEKTSNKTDDFCSYVTRKLLHSNDPKINGSDKEHFDNKINSKSQSKNKLMVNISSKNSLEKWNKTFNYKRNDDLNSNKYFVGKNDLNNKSNKPLLNIQNHSQFYIKLSNKTFNNLEEEYDYYLRIKKNFTNGLNLKDDLNEKKIDLLNLSKDSVERRDKNIQKNKGQTNKISTPFKNLEDQYEFYSKTNLTKATIIGNKNQRHDNNFYDVNKMIKELNNKKKKITNKKIFSSKKSKHDIQNNFEQKYLKQLYGESLKNRKNNKRKDDNKSFKSFINENDFTLKKSSTKNGKNTYRNKNENKSKKEVEEQPTSTTKTLNNINNQYFSNSNNRSSKLTKDYINNILLKMKNKINVTNEIKTNKKFNNLEDKYDFYTRIKDNFYKINNNTQVNIKKEKNFPPINKTFKNLEDEYEHYLKLINRNISEKIHENKIKEVFNYSVGKEILNNFNNVKHISLNKNKVNNYRRNQNENKIKTIAFQNSSKESIHNYNRENESLSKDFSEIKEKYNKLKIKDMICIQTK